MKNEDDQDDAEEYMRMIESWYIKEIYPEASDIDMSKRKERLDGSYEDGEVKVVMKAALTRKTEILNVGVSKKVEEVAGVKEVKYGINYSKQENIKNGADKRAAECLENILSSRNPILSSLYDEDDDMAITRQRTDDGEVFDLL